MVEAVQGMRKRAFIRSLSVHSPIAPHIVVIDHGRREDNCVDEDVAEVNGRREGGVRRPAAEADRSPCPPATVVAAARRRITLSMASKSAERSNFFRGKPTF